MQRKILLSCIGALIALLINLTNLAQGQRGAAPPSPKSVAPVDLTGYWVSIVNEDWRFRMMTAQKGDYDIIPLNAAGRELANNWDPARDEAAGNQCKAYGAAGIMRIPGRLHITWDNDYTLKIEIDAGMQSRLLQFRGPGAPGTTTAPSQPPKPTLQGTSDAQWEITGGRGGRPANGPIKVVTTNMTPGYYFKHGIPYSGNATMTEYISHLEDNGIQYLQVTTVVSDPTYLTQTFVRSLHFKKLPAAAGWNPSPCSAR